MENRSGQYFVANTNALWYIAGLISEATSGHFHCQQGVAREMLQGQSVSARNGQIFFANRGIPHEILQGRNVGARSGRQLIVNLE